MTLTALRKLFVQHSGRYDLVTDPESYADNGANELIRGGLRFLCGYVYCPTEARRVELALAANTVSKLVPYARAIRSVAIADSDADGGWTTLIKIDAVRLANEYKNAEATEEPYHWAVRGAETTETDTYDWRYLDYFDPPLSYTSDLTVFVGPPPSQEITLGIEGLFEETLLEEQSQCWWSIKHPLLVVTAAMMWAEVFNRNREGVRSFLEQIDVLSLPIARDQIEQDASENTQMRNAF